MNNVIASILHMLAPSQSQFVQAATVADQLAATTNYSESGIAGRALAITAAQQGGDLDILNYALTLEHFENVMYRALIGSNLLTGKALDYAKTYGGHENDHVVALTDTITKLGGTPVKEQAMYNLPKVSTEAEVINLIATVEDVGASAYLGAAPLVQNADLLTVAVQIHTVEAEHATVWRALSGQDVVPFAFAPPRTKDEVLKIVTPFLTVMPATMPNTGTSDDTLKVLGVAGTIAVAAGFAIARSQKATAEQQQ